jgi:transketolase
MVSESLSAAEILKGEGIDVRVINMHTIKPIDENAIISAAKETGAVVTAEEHQLNGGLGSAVVEVLAQNSPVPVEMVGVKDSFGESGTPAELMKAYYLKDVDIAQAVRKVIKRKK